ncbi:FkbM family methyltransferase [Streptomyces sp. B1866]|uniref:FkbM family methyltransferase n=1 Tax=Streptomyces sp. B1866 TaxID=3075431 RepID=UPI00288F5C87|nr:FkbM family methyltransferase [Streptomyces sp. B1866]MDT3396245.1 FkbM family methyltransferase [Streptomyces sp. B1866]
MSLSLVELDEGFSAYTSSEMEARFIYREIFEELSYDQNPLPDAPFIVDVGANIGLFSIFMRRRYPRARVIAFEPAPETLDALRRNLALHGVEGVTIYPHGLAAEPAAAVPFTYYPDLPGNSTLHPEEKAFQKVVMTERFGAEEVARYFTPDEITVPVERLSHVLAEHHADEPVIDLLKIDVEGAELDVLGGLDAADWARVRSVVLEAADVDGKLAKIERLLRDQGLTVTSGLAPMLEETNTYYVLATR